MPTKSSRLRLSWPFKGLWLGSSYQDQPEGTAADLQNVRGFDPRTGRNRGAQRAGLSKCPTDQLSAGHHIQDIIVRQSVSTSYATSTAMPGRSMTALAVSNGDIKSFVCGTTFATVTNGSSALDSDAPTVYSSNFYNQVFWVDGTNYKYYTGSSVLSWVAASGTLPADGANTARLIEVYRGRIVLSGIMTDPHNWFMSAVADATDWDYSPAAQSPTQAVAGNNANAGKCPDIIQTMIPFFDDLLIFGCGQSIWQLTGDPMHGGYIDNVSETIGMAFGRPWCLLPDKTILFFSSRGGVYRLVPGQGAGGLERLTALNLDESLATVDLSSTVVRMVWDDRTQGAHLFLTPLTGTTAGTHYFWDQRNNAWYKDKFASYNLDPTAVCVSDGDAPSDRQIFLGCRDSYIRRITLTAENDDTYAIDSYVKLGPIQQPGMLRLRLSDMQCVLGTNSADVYIEGFSGNHAEAAYNGDRRWQDTWQEGRNRSLHRRLMGTALYLKIGNDNLDQHWTFESLHGRLDGFSGRGQRAL